MNLSVLEYGDKYFPQLDGLCIHERCFDYVLLPNLAGGIFRSSYDEAKSCGEDILEQSKPITKLKW